MALIKGKNVSTNITKNLKDQIYDKNVDIEERKTLGATLEDIKTDISSNASNIETIQNNIGTISGEINDINVKLTGIDLTDINNNISTLQGNYNSLSGDISNVQGSISTLQGQYTSLDTDISTIRGSISTNNNAISNLQSAIGNVGDKSLATQIAEIIANMPEDTPGTGPSLSGYLKDLAYDNIELPVKDGHYRIKSVIDLDRILVSLDGSLVQNMPGDFWYTIYNDGNYEIDFYTDNETHIPTLNMYPNTEEYDNETDFYYNAENGWYKYNEDNDVILIQEPMYIDYKRAHTCDKTDEYTFDLSQIIEFPEVKTKDRVLKDVPLKDFTYNNEIKYELSNPNTISFTHLIDHPFKLSEDELSLLESDVYEEDTNRITRYPIFEVSEEDYDYLMNNSTCKHFLTQISYIVKEEIHPEGTIKSEYLTITIGHRDDEGLHFITYTQDHSYENDTPNMFIDLQTSYITLREMYTAEDFLDIYDMGITDDLLYLNDTCKFELKSHEQDEILGVYAYDFYENSIMNKSIFRKVMTPCDYRGDLTYLKTDYELNEENIVTHKVPFKTEINLDNINLEELDEAFVKESINDMGAIEDFAADCPSGDGGVYTLLDININLDFNLNIKLCIVNDQQRYITINNGDVAVLLNQATSETASYLPFNRFITQTGLAYPKLEIFIADDMFNNEAYVKDHDKAKAFLMKLFASELSCDELLEIPAYPEVVALFDTTTLEDVISNMKDNTPVGEKIYSEYPWREDLDMNDIAEILKTYQNGQYEFNGGFSNRNSGYSYQIYAASYNSDPGTSIAGISIGITGPVSTTATGLTDPYCGYIQIARNGGAPLYKFIPGVYGMGPNPMSYDPTKWYNGNSYNEATKSEIETLYFNNDALANPVLPETINTNPDIKNIGLFRLLGFDKFARTLKEEIDSINDKISNLGGPNTEEIDSLNNKVSNLEEDVNSLNDKVSSLEDSTNEIQNQLNDIMQDSGTFECINEDTIKVTELEEGKTYKIPFYHNLRNGAFKNINANTIQGDETIKEFIDRKQGAYLIARLGNIEIYKSDLTLYSNTIYNYTNFPTSPASDSFSDGYYSYLIIKEIKSSGITYYFTSAGTSARSNTSGIMADIPIMASSSFDYPNEQMERIGSTDIPGVTEGCSVIAWLMRGIWFRAEFDSNGNQLGDCYALGNEGMKPTLTRGLNEFNLEVTYKESNSEINNLDALLEILNGSTYQGLDTIEDVGTYAIQYQLPKYLDLLNSSKYQSATEQAFNDNSLQIYYGYGNTPDVTYIKIHKVFGYWEDNNIGNPSYRINKDFLLIDFSGNDKQGSYSSTTGAYIYSPYDLNGIKLILGKELTHLSFENETQNVKAHTWYYFNRQAEPELVEIPRCDLWLESDLGSTYYLTSEEKELMLELLNSEGAKDEDGNFITFEKRVGVLDTLQEQIDELKDTTQGLNNNLESLQEDFDNFKESTQESLDDLQEQIDNIQPGSSSGGESGSCEPLYNKIYKGGSPKELVDGEIYTLRSDIDLSNIESADLLWCNYEINPIGTDIYWSKEDNRLSFYENETDESPEKDYYLIDGEWWSDAWKTSKVENPSFTYDANATEIENMELLLSILEGKEITLEEKLEEPIKDKVYEKGNSSFTSITADKVVDDLGINPLEEMAMFYQNDDLVVGLAEGALMYQNMSTPGFMYIMITTSALPLIGPAYGLDNANVWYNFETKEIVSADTLPEIPNYDESYINPDYKDYFKTNVYKAGGVITLKEKLMSYIEAGEGVSIEPNEDGTKLIVSASGVGKKYLHTFYLYCDNNAGASADRRIAHLKFEIILDTQTQLTINGLIDTLNDKGHNTYLKIYYKVNGYVQNYTDLTLGGRNYGVLGVYNDNGKLNIQYLYKDSSASTVGLTFTSGQMLIGGVGGYNYSVEEL